MKSLTNTSEVIDAWANRDRDKGQAGNVSFESERLFSYATPVAAIVHRVVDATAPLRIVLTTYRRYSVTTSGHIAQARSAANQAGLATIAVASIDAPLDHQRNLSGIAEDAMTHLRKGMRARQHRASHIARAIKRVLELNLYSRFFGLDWDVDPKESGLADRIETVIAGLQATESV